MSGLTQSRGARRPFLRLVTTSFHPAAFGDGAPEWRRIAVAVLSSTRELGRHLMQQRWARVDAAMDERRELLLMMKRMNLDVDGRRCLLSLEQAAHESELAIAAMTTKRR